MSAILCHTNISEVVSKYPPKPVQNLTLTPGKFLVSLTWEDPADYTEEGYTCTWAKTVVVRKQGGYPNDIHDGTVVVTTVERDKYKTSGYADAGLTGGETYYYKLFACSTDGVYSEPTEGTSVPKAYKVMSIIIDIDNSNPASWGTYSDDALDMPNGKASTTTSAWKEFFGYRPCLFKNGQVVKYIDPNNFSKFEDGTDVPSDGGDVMIEFPRRGLKITKNDNIMTISMTDNPNDPDFTYHAHMRGDTDKDNFYLGAYLGYIKNGALRSLSGQTVTINKDIATFETAAFAAGTGYGYLCYFQWLYILCMYLLQFKGNMRSASVLGKGPSSSNSSTPKTGRANKNGMVYGNDTSVVKLFGLEDIYGYVYQDLNNLYVTNAKIYTTTDDRVCNTYSKYEFGTNIGYTYRNAYMRDCFATPELAFIYKSTPKTGESSSTYFCTLQTIAKMSNAVWCGSGKPDGERSLFKIVTGENDGKERSLSWSGTRLQYL